MRGPKPLFLVALIAGLVVASVLGILLKGGLHITHFDGDALHLADIIGRMRAGEAPHQDFMTPIGVWAFTPIAVFVRAGFDLAMSFALGQALFAVALAVWVVRAAATRLPPATGYAFAAISALLVMSLSHGSTGNLAISMHYNRWAWVMAFSVILLSLLPNRSESRPLTDGVLIGTGLASLVLLKITFFVAFAPAIALILLLRREIAMLLVAVLAGLLSAVVLWFALGSTHWLAYLSDLQTVAASDLRTAPGLGLADLVVSPPYLPGAALTVIAAILLRRSGQRYVGLGLLLLFPAFVYVTWQNFGNDPIWLILLAVILFAMRPEPDGKGDVMRRAVGVAGMAAAVLAAPLTLSHGLSVPRHLVLLTTTHVPLIEEADGIFMPRLPAELIRGRMKLNAAGAMFDVVPDPQDPASPLQFAGDDLPDCQVTTGIPSVLRSMARDLEVEEGPVFVADIIGSHWLFGLPRLPGGAPWNYGSLSGIAGARHLVVPLCPVNLAARRSILEELGSEKQVTLVRETPRLRLYSLSP